MRGLHEQWSCPDSYLSWLVRVQVDSSLPCLVQFLLLLNNFPHSSMSLGGIWAPGVSSAPHLALCSVSWNFCIFVIEGALDHLTMSLGVCLQLHYCALGTTLQFINPAIWRQEINPEDLWNLFVCGQNIYWLLTHNLTMGGMSWLLTVPLHGREFNTFPQRH